MGTEKHRYKTSDAFVLFPACYHSSQNGAVKWLPPSILYVFKNEMGCADAFRCLMGDTSVKVPLHALRCCYSKSILFSLLINGKYFLGAPSAWRKEERSQGCWQSQAQPQQPVVRLSRLLHPTEDLRGGQWLPAPGFRLHCLAPRGLRRHPSTVISCCIQACAPPRKTSL